MSLKDIDHRSNRRNEILRFFLILLLASATGYISLSQEILWMRVISYATGSRPEVFAYVLGFFLLGIAFGAFVAKRICEKATLHPLTFIAIMLSISSLIYYFSIPISAQLFTLRYMIGMIGIYFSVAIIAFLIGGIFPVLCHLGIREKDSVGILLSWIYLANILGATAGPLLTGFVLMDVYTMEDNILFVSVITLMLSTAVWLVSPVLQTFKKLIIGTVVCVIFGLLLVHPLVFTQSLEKLHYKNRPQREPYKYVIQNRSGIIAVKAGDPDIVYGGGVYDGAFNTDPVNNSNWIRRAYMIMALHPHPQEVMEIGLGTGSWAWVLASHTELRKLIIVEINPGYLELLREYPEFATLLENPKVEIHVDDGRRWLNRHPEVKFDIIVMNTTFHWRSYTANLLSREFFQLCKRHLKEGGIIYYNATGSEDAAFTTAQVFHYLTRFRNCIAASDKSFTMTPEERRSNLLKLQNETKPIFDPSDSTLQDVLEELVESDISDKAEKLRTKEGLRIVTDNNMATEYKRWYRPGRTWFLLFKKLGLKIK